MPDEQARLDAAIDRCAEEPIHVPGSIQPHGELLVFDAERFELLQASANAAVLPGIGFGADGRPRADARFREAIVASSDGPPADGSECRVDLGGVVRRLTWHPGPQGWLVELEPAAGSGRAVDDGLHPRVRRLLERTEAAASVEELCRIAAAELRALTGFHRVLVYRFDEDGHGTVIAEDGDGTLPAYLDLRFPASDIPAQARALYGRHRLRLIADVDHVPVPVLPALSPLDGRPLDLSAAALRSVSPVHLEYMRAMGTAASMSISILVDGTLWGLIACHHARPHRPAPALRTSCDFIGRVVSMQVGAHERSRHASERLALAAVEAELLARVSRAPSLARGLRENAAAWLGLARAGGAALVKDGNVVAVGQTPTVPQIKDLAAALAGRASERPVATDALAQLHPPAGAHADVAAGLLAVRISALHPHFVFWFRPEVVRTVRWAGEPAKSAGPDGRLHPRRSFASWADEVRGRSEPWSLAEIETAQSFMNTLVSSVLKRAEERAELTGRLEASNRELEAFSYSVSHDLRAPFRHVVGYAQLLRERGAGLDDRARHYLDAIVDAASSAGKLVDDLLSFSQLGRAALEPTPIDMDKLVSEVRQSLELDVAGRPVEWRISPLPPAFGDGALIRQAVGNLFENALKYSRDRRPAVIEVHGRADADETVYTVCDNGVGFDMAYVGKLFGVFQRLHHAEEFEGTGIGLALVRRILERHGGWIVAEGRPGAGATFRFGLPKPQRGRS